MTRITNVPKVVLLLLGIMLPAAAQQPTITLIPFTASFIPAGVGCSFPVLITPQAGRPNGERLIQFANTAIIAGPLFVTLTNLSTGKTVDVNTSGPTLIDFAGTTPLFVTLGPSIPGPLAASVAAAAGLPIVPLIHGRAVFTVDAFGNVTSVSVTGTAQDVCQLLS